MYWSGNLYQSGVIAQLAERYFCKVKDVGSNPIGSTRTSLKEVFNRTPDNWRGKKRKTAG